jgi:hypothetical protein
VWNGKVEFRRNAPNQKKFKKDIALKPGFDIFLAPRRPKGRQDSMFANR